MMRDGFGTFFELLSVVCFFLRCRSSMSTIRSRAEVKRTALFIILLRFARTLL